MTSRMDLFTVTENPCPECPYQKLLHGQALGAACAAGIALDLIVLQVSSEEKILAEGVKQSVLTPEDANSFANADDWSQMKAIRLGGLFDIKMQQFVQRGKLDSAEQRLVSAEAKRSVAKENCARVPIILDFGLFTLRMCTSSQVPLRHKYSIAVL